MHKLDNLPLMKKLDPSNMLGNVDDLPEQFSHAWQETKNVIIPSNYIQFQNVVLLGMGASGIGGSLVKALVAEHENVPVAVVRDYTLPSYVSRNSLVIGVSYSGNTEETVAAFSKAAGKGAKLIAITSGGELEHLVHRYRAPAFRINYVSQPRAAFGYLFVPLLALFHRVGLIQFTDKDLADVVQAMEERRSKIGIDVPFSRNQAKKLAERMMNRIVLLVGGSTFAEVARRWKSQLNENSKQAAFLEVMPELCHNTIVGLDFPRAQSKALHAILLLSEFDHPRNKLRLQILSTLLAKKGIPYDMISSEKPKNPVAELSDIIFLGNYVSHYLAILNGVDPTPVEPIERLKKELAKHT